MATMLINSVGIILKSITMFVDGLEVEKIS